MLVYLARHVLSVAHRPLVDAGVAVEGGRIVAVGRKKDVLKAAGSDAPVRDLGDSILFPGLVNAHTHLELSWAKGAAFPGGGFVGWLRAFLERRPSIDDGAARAAAAEAIAALPASGTVAVGEVANETWSAALLAGSPLRAIVFHEVLGFRAADADAKAARAADEVAKIAQDPSVAGAGDGLRVVSTPHAAYTTSPPLLKALAARAHAAGTPLSIHAAESAEEVEMLATGEGPLADLLKERGHWDDGWRVPGLSPISYLDRLGLLDPKTLVVHAVHLDHQDLSLLQARGSCVVTCPRSNRRLEVGRAPVAKLLSSGIPVALGTDSLATNEDLDLVAEMVALREEHPELAPAAVLRMATLNGAAALGFAHEIGSLEPGKAALLLAAPLWEPRDDPFETVTWGPESIEVLRGDGGASPD